MHVVGWLPENYKDRIITGLAKENEVIVLPVSDYSLNVKLRPGLVMGYTAFNKKQLSSGVRLLKKILTNYKS